MLRAFAGRRLEYILGMEVTQHTIACVLTALYLPGGPNKDRLPRRRWMAIDRLLRQRTTDLGQAQRELLDAGFWLESSVLSRQEVLNSSEKLVRNDDVLVSCQDAYPARWIMRLGAAAPPALWKRGEMPAGTSIAVVGARSITPTVARFAESVAKMAVERNLFVVSGGAAGSDRAAAKAVLASSIAEPQLCEILPYGLGLARGAHGCLLSLSPAYAEFSTAAAMERNTLIYASSERSVVVHARYRAGGAWHGAIECLRRRLSHLYVRANGSECDVALKALGATLLSRPEDCFGNLAEERTLLDFAKP